MAFGYDASATFGKSVSDVIDHTKSLLGSLVDKGENSEVYGLKLARYDEGIARSRASGADPGRRQPQCNVQVRDEQ